VASRSFLVGKMRHELGKKSKNIVFERFFSTVLSARCVYHKGKTFVVYHKVTDVFPCGIFYHKHFLQFQGPLWYFVI